MLIVPQHGKNLRADNVLYIGDQQLVPSNVSKWTDGTRVYAAPYDSDKNQNLPVTQLKALHQVSVYYSV
jgi:hypothetical protein